MSPWISWLSYKLKHLMNSLLDNFWHYVMPEIILSNFIIYLVKCKKLKFPFCFSCTYTFIYTQKRERICLSSHPLIFHSILFGDGMAFHITRSFMHTSSCGRDFWVIYFNVSFHFLCHASLFLIPHSLSYSLTRLLAFKTQQIMKIGENKKKRK